jgi:hypothetical protein
MTPDEMRVHLADAAEPGYISDHEVRIRLRDGLALDADGNPRTTDPPYDYPPPALDEQGRRIHWRWGEPNVYKGCLTGVTDTHAVIGGKLYIKLEDIASVERLCGQGEQHDHPS